MYIQRKSAADATWVARKPFGEVERATGVVVEFDDAVQYGVAW